MKKILRKRYIRNILMITMIIVLAACSCFTYGYAKEQAQSNAIDNIQSQFGERPSGNMPDFDNSQSGGEQSDGNSTNNTPQAPPDMQNGDNQGSTDGNTPPEKPDGEAQGNSDGSTPPEMPNGNEQSGSTESANGPSRSENSPNKSKPSGSTDNQQSQNNGSESSDENTENGPSKGGNQQMPSDDNRPDFGGQRPDMGGSAIAQIDTKYIVILAAENLMLFAIIVYLLLSRFNKRGFKQTLKNTKNAIIFAITVALLTGAVTFAQFAISGKTEIPFDGRPDMSQSQMLPDNGESSDDGQTTDGESSAADANTASTEFEI
jgi:DNA mismatch repair ATPase MutL